MNEYNAFHVDVAICDDAADDLSAISRRVKEYMARKKIEYTPLIFDHAEDVIDGLSYEDVYTVLLLNVQVGNQDGIAIAKDLHKTHIDCKLILISSNRDMALRGYETQALRYLEKPLDPDLFDEAMDCAFACLPVGLTLLLPTEQGNVTVDVDDILYIEPNNRRVVVYCHQRKLEVSMKFSDIIEQLPTHQFVLSHRTVLVNLSHVKLVGKSSLLLRNGTILPLSKYRTQEVKTAYLNYTGKAY